jgi:hypothetical protein
MRRSIFGHKAVVRDFALLTLSMFLLALLMPTGDGMMTRKALAVVLNSVAIMGIATVFLLHWWRLGRSRS